ncbi:pyridoxal phosphatase [Spirochaetia bacterium]|nr:pyridoxal phosphatase [Spirochaetia bacterium]
MREEALRKAGQEIRLIVCDMDGTLLSSRRRISPGTLAAVREAQERGIFVTLCSGRAHAMMYMYSRILAIEGPLIACNGAIVLDTRTGELLDKKLMVPDAIMALMEFCRSKGFDHLMVSSEGCWYGEGSKRVYRFEEYNHIAEADSLPLVPLHAFGPDYRPSFSGEIYNALISGLSAEGMRMTVAEIQSIGSLAYTSSEQGLLDISAAGVHKGEGIRSLARLLGMEKHQICVFGDFLNDIPMFAEAGLPIAMGNGEEPVKAQARAVTDSNDEDGVARAIRRYIL